VSAPTASDLASLLQQDVDTSTANLLLASAQAEFELAAGTKFSATTTTWTIEGRAQTVIAIPDRPLISVSAARIAGATLTLNTDYYVRGNNLYRLVGWGRNFVPPDLVEVDYTYGYTAIPDDVRAAILDAAAQGYINPDRLTRTQIDDYVEQRSRGGVGLTPFAASIATLYRRGGFA
jgi:hypothetical protein